MSRALFIIDVQNDFTEGGALGVIGGNGVAAGITELVRANPGRYDHVFASRDWHDGSNDNGGHFATDGDPDYIDTWPAHCVSGTPGAEYNPAIDESLIDVHVRKGQGKPAYSIFEGTTDAGTTVAETLDALATGRSVRVLTGLIAGVAATSSAAALDELAAAGAELTEG